jgi:hypothetical protein
VGDTDGLERDAIQTSTGEIGDRIYVTPEMIRAGVLELRERCLGEPLDKAVKDVSIVMSAARNSGLG